MPAGKLVSDDDIKKEIENLNIKKSSIYGFIPASILKQRLGAYIPQLTTSFQHNSIPQELKLSEMIHYRRRTMDLKVSYHKHPRFLRQSFTNKLPTT